MPSKIYIVPVWPVRKEYLKSAQNVIRTVFGLDSVIHNRNMDAKEVCDPFRDQYLASSILVKLNEHPQPKDAAKIIGITDVDIFEPVFEYLFGEAQLDGLCVIVSAFRLHNRLYGLPENREMLLDRLYKEIVHELGHAFSLIHCFAPMCVMNPSTYIEQIDSKSREFCTSCQRELDLALAKYRQP
jgi:archaemetzincin